MALDAAPTPLGAPGRQPKDAGDSALIAKAARFDDRDTVVAERRAQRQRISGIESRDKTAGILAEESAWLHDETISEANRTHIHEALVRRNLPLLYSRLGSLESRFGGDRTPMRLTRDDLFASAHHGLSDAVLRFDPSEGFKFSTYAVRYIDGYTQRYVRDHHPAKADVWTFTKVLTARRAMEGGDTATAAQIAAFLKDHPDKKLRKDIDPAEIQKAEERMLVGAPRSLDAEVVIHGVSKGDLQLSVSCGDTADNDMARQWTDSPERQVVAAELREGVLAALEGLDAKDRAIVFARLVDEKPWREVGKAVGMSGQGAQNRCARVLTRLSDELYPVARTVLGASHMDQLIDWDDALIALAKEAASKD
jgi:RNA polymerase sigma factor (sigma-70 family)